MKRASDSVRSFVRGATLRRKLLTSVFIAMAAAIVLTGATVLSWNAINIRANIASKVQSEARIIASNLTAAITFKDSAAAEDVLRSLRGDHAVALAQVIQPDGSTFARFTADDDSLQLAARPQTGEHVFAGEFFILSQPIDWQGDRLGEVIVQYDLRTMRRQLWQGAAMLTGVFLAAMLAAMLFSIRRVRVLTRPIEELARTTRCISEDGNYERRATKLADDELGALTDAFNDMLFQIQRRERELNSVMDQLEERVAARTRALEMSNERNRVILQTALDAVIIMNEEGVITGWNPQAEATFGFSIEEAIGCRLDELIIPEELRAAHRQGIERFIKHSETNILGQRAEVEAQHRDGRRFPVELSVNAVRTGDELLFSGFVRDITERRAHEAELRAAKEAAEAANRAKSAFLANMSHEIRTPMTAILGFVEMLHEGSVREAERLDAIRTIRRNGEHLLQIINDVLDLSKIEAGRMDIQFAPHSLKQIIRDVVMLMRDRAEGKGLVFHVEFPEPLPERIVTDDMRLRQILINLLGNAIKFTETGSVKLIVRPDPDGPPSRLRFEISDTGVGIPAERLAQLFRPFSQADSTMSRRYGGSGLGLAISAELANCLGGTISVNSTLNVGSTFTVVIDAGDLTGVPLALPDLHEPARDDHRAELHTLRADRWNGHRALLVEDGPDNQRLILFLLERLGFAVTLASNGQEGIDTAEAAAQSGQPFDLIIMDMQMPILDGYEATRRLRERGYKHPIIALTAHAMRGDREKCLAAGCNSYASKPIDRATLTELISHLLDDSRASDGADDQPGDRESASTTRAGRSGAANRSIVLRSTAPSGVAYPSCSKDDRP